MTTKVRIENSKDSNGDLILSGFSTTNGSFKDFLMQPGTERELWITDNSALIITERWPTSKPRPVPANHSTE